MRGFSRAFHPGTFTRGFIATHVLLLMFDHTSHDPLVTSPISRGHVVTGSV